MSDSTLSKQKQVTVLKLLGVVKEEYGKLGELLQEIDDLLGGGAGSAARLKMAEIGFDVAWCSRYAPGQENKYVWNYGRDRVQMKRLIKMLGVEELVTRFGRFVVSDDPFYVRNRHAFGVFVANVNGFTEDRVAPAEFELGGAPTVADCRHTPRCRDDQTHTALKGKELRAN